MSALRLPLPLALTLAASALGCHAAAIDDRANAEIQTVHATAERDAVYPTCRDASEVTTRCGLLLVRAAREDVRSEFRASRCASLGDDACQQLFAQSLDAALARRYPLADWDAVGRTCDVSPARCAEPKAYELMLLDSHNAAVRDRAAREENAIEDRRAAEHEADVARGIGTTTRVLGEIAYTAHDGPKCRTYPSLFSGMASTVCTP